MELLSMQLLQVRNIALTSVERGLKGRRGENIEEGELNEVVVVLLGLNLEISALNVDMIYYMH